MLAGINDGRFLLNGLRNRGNSARTAPLTTNERFLVERNGEPTALISSVGDFVKTFAPQMLKGIQDDAKRKGLDKLIAACLLVAPRKMVTAALDPDDNMFLEGAEAAGAGYLVTGNRRHFPGQWKTTRVVGVREFIETLLQSN